jgi:hypothetical protein
MDTALISLISACTALVASVVGPIVTLTVAKRQINANVLSANRQKWIDSLRDMLAELISLLVGGWVITSRGTEKGDGPLGAIAADRALEEKLERIVLVQWKIRLLINPSEPDHQELHRTIDAAVARLSSDEPGSSDQLRADIEKITTLAQAILKREWQRVKRGT